MSAVFLKLLNMSITAGWLLLAVFAARLLLKKAPRWIVCLLWALAGLRLLLPFSLKSMFSLIPSAETVPANIAVSPAPAIHTGISVFNSAVNPIITETFAPKPAASVNPLQTVLFIASIVWAVGVAAMLLYALISFLRLRKTVAAAVPVGKRILLCDEVRTPFILGVFRPKICLPSSMRGETLDCVIAHETAHLKRRDHWWKPLGFLLLSVYWFHPLCWVAYILLCRDIETACDEKVIRDMDHASKAAYSQALLDCSMQRKTITACPLAFGEAGVKQRVKGILNYKKPAFWIILIAVVVCVVIAVCLLTDPRPDEPPEESTATSESLPDSTAPSESQPIETPARTAAVKWFDFRHGEEEQWKQFTLDAFPDTVFQCSSSLVEAVTDQGTKQVISGMPIESVYVCDLNGDGAPEICAAVYYGSGMIDERIEVCDYRSGAWYELSSRGNYDYSLNLQEGGLIVEKCRYNATWFKDEEILATGRLTLEKDGLHLYLEEQAQGEDADAESEKVDPPNVQILYWNIMDVLTRIYSDEELTEIEQFQGTLLELNPTWPIQCRRKKEATQYVVYPNGSDAPLLWIDMVVSREAMQYVVYRSESDVLFLYFDMDGNRAAWPARYRMTHTREEFETLQVGDTLDDVMAFDPDGSYLFLYTGRVDAPRVSTHCTTDGYLVKIAYDDAGVVTSITSYLI